jgi:AcrR family transcriptional regulator
VAGEASDHRLRQAEWIVQSALELVFSHGVSALSMSAIAQAAGVSRQTLYKYFPDVESVLRAAVQSSSHDTASITAEKTPVDQLRAFIQYVLGAAAAGHPSPAALEPVLAPDTRAELEAHAVQVRGMLAMILRRGMDDGTFRPNLEPDGDADIVYRTVMALSDLIAQAVDVDAAMARAERSVLAMVGYDR